ncbi:MAG: aminotransferase class I/II-fold pyridoxal phosphate-dependent enzyme [Gammaproteobacteria bacterium]|nr:aminotransferase class I/II-fold pyridoxal phosphate-dependent enzyme [Gammaproteobacteria bacterium]
MSSASLRLPGFKRQPESVTRKMAAALPGLRAMAQRKGLSIHHLGAGYPHPEVTNPKSFIRRTESWFEHLARREGLNDESDVPEFLREAYAYTDTMGPRSPRESFAHVYGNDWGVELDPDLLIPTVGATGGIALLCSVFERVGNKVAYITDAPTYAGFLARATLNQNASVYSVDMDFEGADPDVLRDQIRQARSDGYFVPFYYTVPDGHNPAGFSFSEARKRELLRVAKEEDILIVEDAPYLYINYASDPQQNKPFISHDASRVVHLFTGSKIGLPGPRVGFIYTEATMDIDGESNAPLSALLLSESSGAILFHNPLTLLSFESLLRHEDGSLRDSLWPIADEKLRIYKENRDIVLEGLAHGLAAYDDLFSWTQPDAGFFTAFTIKSPHVRNDDEFIAHLVERYGVVVVPMYGFYPDDYLARSPNAGYDQLRLSFCFTESHGDERRRDLELATEAFCHAMKEEFTGK